MDFLQTRQRYRRERSRRTFFFFLRLVLMGVCVWLGWSWGYSRNSAIAERSNSDVISLRQENERLAQRLTALENELEEALRRQEAIALERAGNANAGDTPSGRIARQVARHLAGGIDEESISFALNTLAKPSRCRTVGGQDVGVATDLFAGPDSVATMLDGGMKIFLAGEAGRDATRDKPWYDPRRPVSMRIAYLGGEQMHEATLPFKVDVFGDGWVIRVNASPADLQGYANVTLEKCGVR